MSDKYPRISADPSQLEQFKNDFLNGKVGLPELPDDLTKEYELKATNGELHWTER